MFGGMSQSDQQVNAYQLRIVLRRTSPHIWRRVVVRSDSTLGQLHQAVQALFGWADSRPHRFVLRGRSLGASATAAASSLPGAEVPLSEFKLLAKERFFYDYGFDPVNVPVWRHDIRFEAALVAGRERLPHCIGGVGSPPLEQTDSPLELTTLAELFTPQFVHSWLNTSGTFAPGLRQTGSAGRRPTGIFRPGWEVLSEGKDSSHHRKRRRARSGR
jgi:hypothetical protein